MRLISLVFCMLLTQEPIRTADITVRGLTPADFPRITKVAANVYAYEQIDPTKRIVTANNLIVVSNEGVLVAEGQGTVDNVKRLVADIATLTPQPIKYVVVGSEHGDHTGGDAAFPRRRRSSCIRFRKRRSSAGSAGRPRPSPTSGS